MAKYYYNKYNVNKSYAENSPTLNSEQNLWTVGEQGKNATGSVFTGYTFNTATGEFEGTGTRYDRPTKTTCEGKYFFGNNTTGKGTSMARLIEYLRDRRWGSDNQYLDWVFSADKYTRREIEIRGSLVQSNIIAENGTYPADGKHSDGFWYVRGSLVTPGTPTSITVPTKIKGGTTITISWGTSSNSDSYRLERQLNGGSWSQIYSGTARSYSDTIPKGTISVAYRVRGANGTAYSSYRTSSTITVQNFPEMRIRVNGALKTSDAGWVKVNGQLREIDSIYTKIDGVLKEV